MLPFHLILIFSHLICTRYYLAIYFNSFSNWTLASSSALWYYCIFMLISLLYSGEKETCRRLASCVGCMQRQCFTSITQQQIVISRAGRNIFANHLHIAHVRCSRTVAAVPQLLDPKCWRLSSLGHSIQHLVPACSPTLQTRLSLWSIKYPFCCTCTFVGWLRQCCVYVYTNFVQKPEVKHCTDNCVLGRTTTKIL